MTDLLRIEGLAAGYLGQPVVRDLDLTVASGEVVALLGPNGAGKTTTMTTVAGVFPSLGGSIMLDGVNVAGTPAHRRARMGISLVPEDRSLFFDLTTRENLMLGRRRGQVQQSALIAMLPELEKCLNRKAGVLSGGEQQMLALGRGILTQPKLLLVDEMSLGLAPVIVQRLLPILRRLAGELGMGILFVEQHVSLALRVADRAYVLNQGRVVLSAAAAELRADPSLVADSYLGNQTGRA